MGQSSDAFEIEKLRKDLSKITDIIRGHGHIFLACGIDKNGNIHIADFGLPQEAFKKLVGENLKTLNRVLIYYFDVNQLEKSKSYALKLYVENNETAIEYFASLEDILPIKKFEALK